ncbi:MAG: MFS transporter [Sulfuricurvum sp.]
MQKPAFGVLIAISFSHLLNDLIQSLVVALYPLLRSEFVLSFAQIGLITLVFQLTASLLQPLVGIYTDRRAMPYSLAFGMLSTLAGLLLFAYANSYALLLVGAATIGIGSSIFHPESSRVARMASAGQSGLAQSIFQVGGNIGMAFGPLLAAWIVLPNGQKSIVWFAFLTFVAMIILTGVGNWYKAQTKIKKATATTPHTPFPKPFVLKVMSMLFVLMFSKFFYLASISSYLIFYLVERFSISEIDAQYHLFFFLASVAVGTIAGGGIGDRIGHKNIIAISIVGSAPFALMLPFVGLSASTLLFIIIGLLLASAFPAIVVYAQDLLPDRVGMVSGLFFGIAFGLGGIGAGVLGFVADSVGIISLYHITALLPLLGIVAFYLPNLKQNVT